MVDDSPGCPEPLARGDHARLAPVIGVSAAIRSVSANHGARQPRPTSGHTANSQLWPRVVGASGPKLGTMGGFARGDASSEISEWVEQNFTPTEVDGITLYDLTSPVA